MKKEKDFELYLVEWLKGIRSEVKFWDRLMESSGAIGGCKEVYNLRISPNTRFSLESEIETAKIKFCDIGSGPFSNCGIYTDKAKLEITAIDPLAVVYQKLKEEHHVSSPITPITGMVELLNEQFESSTFDIVHMSNSLDHCFDPLEGIRQMLYVCKVGGKVILRHNENEAEHAKYAGFHQWNIQLEEREFIIWRDGIRINVGEMISDYAVIERAEMVEEKILTSNWRHNEFVLRKKKNFELEENAYKRIIWRVLLEEICKLNLND